jgi:hypothetical protein
MTTETIFGNAPIQPEEIFRLLRDKVEDRAKQIYGVPSHAPVHAAKPWTEAVFLSLNEGLINNYGGRAACTKLGATEFMLDFVWWEQNDRRVIMGVECEWTTAVSKSAAPEQAAYDFKKLLCFKAPLKLFVFDSNQETGEATRERLCDCLRKFQQHVTGERYLSVEVQLKKRPVNDHFYGFNGFALITLSMMALSYLMLNCRPLG